MEARIAAARAASGYRTTSVIGEVEAALGTIPAACRSGGSSPALTVAETTVARGGSVTATWADLPTPNTYAFIGLYAVGALDAAFLEAQSLDATHTTSSASGSMSFPIPGAPLAPGSYELRVFHDESMAQRDATSNTFTVTAGEVTGLTISANTTITFLGEPTSVGLTAGTGVPVVGDPTGVSLSATATVPFLSDPSSLTLTAQGTPSFLGEPTSVSLTIP
jgi:hypothetical protein